MQHRNCKPLIGLLLVKPLRGCSQLDACSLGATAGDAFCACRLVPSDVPCSLQTTVVVGPVPNGKQSAVCCYLAVGSVSNQQLQPLTMVCIIACYCRSMVGE